MARILTAVVRALADHPTAGRALAGDRADHVHAHPGLLGRPYPCDDPRCSPGASAPTRPAQAPTHVPAAA
jgi:hypothetical protein